MKAFYGCDKLTSVTIPNSVVLIGGGAFKNCTALTSVVFNAENCTTMGSGSSPVFEGCSNLTSITIGEKVKSIPNNAFYECRALTSITIPNSVTSIGDFAFCVCCSLTSLTIPNSVTSIGDCAFAFCNGLTSITIPNSVTEIGKQAFRTCLALTSVTIPSSVTSIGEEAFMLCSAIASFTSLNTTPPTLTSENVFTDIPSDCPLFVPKASIEAYKVATGWTYFNKVYAIEDGMVETIGSEASKVTVEGGAIRVEGAEGAVAEVYSLSGALLYRGTDSTIALPRGIYIVKVAGTTTKVIL